MDKNNSINSLDKGLVLDVAPTLQPKGSYRYALNMVDETNQGDINSMSVEESTFLFTTLKEGYIPLNSLYIGDKKFVIWSVSKDDSISEIGILDIKAKKYETKVNDESSIPAFKLNFSVLNQIQGVFRLRGGCDTTIYWTDKKSPVRYFNFNKEQNFKNNNGMWVASKFNLQKTYKSIPNFNDVSVIESGGFLIPGGYNIGVQYVDEDLNPTEIISTTPVIKIYNDLTSKNYAEIGGSINSDSDYLNFPATNKAIKIKLGNLDKDYIYYRLAIICSNNGSGNINKVYYTDKIPTGLDEFIYTGQNHVSEGNLNEVAAFTAILGKVGHIEQIENRLILADVEGQVNNYCALQKIASQIKTDCVLKEVILNSIEDPANTKNPTYDFNGGAGLMPGEIYSRAIVFIYEDNSLSPAFHIPGKAPGEEGVVYSKGDKVYPMSTDNQSETSLYLDNDSCSKEGYWGLDYLGIPLSGKKVRHHRLPLRSNINVPLITNINTPEYENKYYNLRLNIKGGLKIPIPCPEDKPDCKSDISLPFSIRVDYKADGELFFFTEEIDPKFYANNTDSVFNLDIYEDSRFHSTSNIFITKINISDENGIYQDVKDFNHSLYFTDNPSFDVEVITNTSTVKDKVVKSNIFGLRFSGIRKPTKEETGGLEVIGYYIVGNERTEFDKTILDSAVLFPSVVNDKYISHGLLQPETDKISKDTFGVLHPEHKFNNREYISYDSIIQEGNYNITERKYGKINYDDVYDGSSFNEKNHKDGNDDGHSVDGDPTSRGFDGWSFNLITRDSIVNFEAKNTFNIKSEDIKENFYLDALESKSINNAKNDFYNIACDNKIGVIQTKQENIIKGNLPYVIFKKNNADPYSNFRSLPYYKQTLNPVYFTEEESTINVFNGDTFITSMRYNNSIYWDNRVADRRGKKSFLKIILGIVIAIAGAVLAFFTGGASSIVIGAGIALIGAGALYASSGIKIANFNKAYSEEYEKGLRQTALDSWTDMFYNYKSNIPFGFFGNGRTGSSGPSDDTIQWLTDCVTDLWFESSVNMNLRNGFSEDSSPTYLASPWRVESGNDTPIGTWEFFGAYYTNSNSQRYPVSSLERHISRKLLAFDEQRDDNRYYLGAALGEYYQINPDYVRTNKEKAFFHLPLEYDCCSDCQEKFPHRWHWSEQFFQEELSDNYRVFLPNNYRDIEGETGKITNIFKLGNDFFIHTEEALWQAPRNQQERITDQIVSFIGTGEYFSIPPRKIIDADNGNSAGTQHKWSTLKSPAGVFFISENQAKIYKFDGKLTPISSFGIESWFTENLEIKTDKDYYVNIQEKYPFRDNPSNPYGTGFIMNYDGQKERILVTKLDNIIEGISYSNIKLALKNGNLVVFNNINRLLEEMDSKGWVYQGEEKGKLKFLKEIYEPYTLVSHKNGIRSERNSFRLKTIYSYVEGIVDNNIKFINNSWTISYALKKEVWKSWHSYFPRFYMNTGKESFASLGDNMIYKFNKTGDYNTFFGKKVGSVIDYVLTNHITSTTIVDGISYYSIVQRYHEDTKTFVEETDITFDKIMFYNSYQNSGELDIVVKGKDDTEDYMWQQVQNLDVNEIVADRNENDWYVNSIRDIRVDYTKPMFNMDLRSKQSNYYTDKVLNSKTLNYHKDWTEMESFRDKFLAVRLSFNNFENVKLMFNYSVVDEKQSFR